MRYPLDFESTFEKTLLFWITRFIKSKVTSLSNRHVEDKNKLASIIAMLNKGFDSIELLTTTTKELRNLGIISIHVYYTPLEKLFYYLKEFGASSMREIDEELLSDFLASQTASLSDASKKNYRIALIAFFGYIDKQNEEDDSNAYRFGIELKNWGGLGGKKGLKLPSFMHQDEVRRFIEAIDAYPFSPDIMARNRLIIKVILYTGIRVGEALSIKLKDISHDESTESYILQVRGKGNKPRVVMIKKRIIEHDLKNWQTQKTCDNALLFCNHKGTMLTQSYVSRTVEQILLSAGIRKEKNGAHMLRHTFATMLYQKSHDLILVQESLGHADINTSRIYTHFDQARLIKTTDIF